MKRDLTSTQGSAVEGLKANKLRTYSKYGRKRLVIGKF